MKLLCLEEFQHVIEARNKGNAHIAANWLKDLCDERICPIVVSGQTHIESVMDCNAQIANRVGGHAYVTPYDWSNEAERKEFCLFIYLLQKGIRLPEPSRLHEPYMALRIHHFAGGCAGRAAKLVRRAYGMSLSQDLPSITEEILAEAVDDLRSRKEQQRSLNPFRVAELQPSAPVSMYEDLEQATQAATEELRRERRIREEAKAEEEADEWD